MKTIKTKTAKLSAAVALSLALLGNAVAKPNPHPVNSLEYGEVLFEYYQDHHFPALTQYFYARNLHVLKEQGNEATLVSGGINVGLTMPQHAVAIFEGLLQHAKDDATRQQAWYHLAKLYFNLGDYERANKAIDHVGDALPEIYKQRFYALYINLKVRSKSAEALEEQLDNMIDKPGAKAYAEFNLGIARHRDQEALEDIVEQFLAAIALAPNNEAGKSLIDKTYLTLAKIYTDNNQFEKANEYYKKVRIDATYGSNALLGYGWTLTKMGSYEAALTPWSVLAKQNLEDPRVLEANLAIPYALEQLDAGAQALEYYQSADVKFKTAMVQMDQLSKKLSQKESNFLDVLLAVQPEEAIGWQADINFALKKGEISELLTDFMASKKFQKGFSNYRDLYYLKRNLEHWHAKLALYQQNDNNVAILPEQDQAALAMAKEKKRLSAFSHNLIRKQQQIAHQLEQLNKTIAQQRAALIVMTQSYLGAQKTRIAQYQSQGRLAIARIYDQAEQQTANLELNSTKQNAGE